MSGGSGSEMVEAAAGESLTVSSTSGLYTTTLIHQQLKRNFLIAYLARIKIKLHHP